MGKQIKMTMIMMMMMMMMTKLMMTTIKMIMILIIKRDKNLIKATLIMRLKKR